MFKGVTKLPLSRLKSTWNKDSKKGFRFRVGRLQAEILKRLYFSPFVREKKLRRSHYALRIYLKHSKPSAPLNSACFGAWWKPWWLKIFSSKAMVTLRSFQETECYFTTSEGVAVWNVVLQDWLLTNYEAGVVGNVFSTNRGFQKGV